MNYLPLFFDLKNHPCLVVGGGEIAHRKVKLLDQVKADVKVVAPVLCDDLVDLMKDSRHIIARRPFESTDLNGVYLVICATNNQVLNKRISALAREKFIPVNVVDDAELSTVIFPSIIDRSPVLIAVSTSGTSPVLGRKIRELLEGLIPTGYGRLATFLGERRAQLKQRYTDPVIRRRKTESFLASPGEELAKQGKYTAAHQYLFPTGDNNAEQDDQRRTGEVYLVGAGPGDPDLLTLKALQMMQKADVVLYDNLVSDEVLSRVRRDARLEYVGKKAGADVMPQETINEMLIRLAKEGLRVLRLKGGDPFIFGRGGEEIENLVAEGIAFQVVPGITAASGCAAYAGIPLTHRDYSQSVRFVTGHPKNGEVDLEWREFAHSNQTIVFYMGLGGLETICSRLISHGRDIKTPVAVISKGTTPEQQTVIGDLQTISSLVKKENVKRPTLIIVGEVVALHDSLTARD